MNNEKYFNEAFDCAAEFCAYLCQKYDWTVDKICSHKEAHTAGYASNHGDPENWLVKFSKDMNWFRKKVQAILDAAKKEQTASTAKSNVLYRVQVGAFSNKENAEAYVKKLKAAGFDAFITEVTK